MANKLKVNDFTLGTNAMVLFEQLIGGSITEVLADPKAQSFGMAMDILACTYKDGTVESYSDFKAHPEFDDLMYRDDFLASIFEKFNKDAENKRKKYQPKGKK